MLDQQPLTIAIDENVRGRQGNVQNLAVLESRPERLHAYDESKIPVLPN